MGLELHIHAVCTSTRDAYILCILVDIHFDIDTTGKNHGYRRRKHYAPSPSEQHRREATEQQRQVFMAKRLPLFIRLAAPQAEQHA